MTLNIKETMSIQNIIQLILYVVTIVSVYWRLKINIALVKKDICDLTKDMNKDISGLKKDINTIKTNDLEHISKALQNNTDITLVIKESVAVTKQKLDDHCKSKYLHKK